MYKLDKKGLGYYKDKKPRSVALAVSIGALGPREMIKKEEEEEEEDRHKGHSSGGKMRWDTY